MGDENQKEIRAERIKIEKREILGQSERISRLIGKVGSEVLSRVMGIIVAAIAIQFIVDGILGLI